jgi:hypothetical protein
VLASEADLGAALAALIGDGPRRERLAAAALARARTRTWDASARGVLEVFHRVVDDHARRLCVTE